jgi:transcriptional regulator with XRE-family HTH domain
LKDIGKRIRKIRLRQDRTLEEVAQTAHLTRSMLSKVENGKAIPAVGSLVRIASALGVPAAALLDESSTVSTIYQKSVVKEVPVYTEKGYGFTTLAATRPVKLMHPYLFRAKRGEVKRHRLSHSGEEFIYMLEGVMRYKVGHSEYVLSAGDALYFDCEEAHSLMPMTEEVLYIAVMCEDQGKEIGKKRKSTSEENPGV